MNKKILTIFFVGMFLLTGLTTSSVLGIESINNESTSQALKSKVSSVEQYPDLIVRPIVKIHPDPFFKFLLVRDIDILVKNIGNDTAVFPANTEYVKTIYFNKLNGDIFEVHWETYDGKSLILGPNEEYIRPAYLDFILSGLGGTITFIVDPNNIVEEGYDGGEDNNEHILKIGFFNQDIAHTTSPSFIKNLKTFPLGV